MSLLSTTFVELSHFSLRLCQELYLFQNKFCQTVLVLISARFRKYSCFNLNKNLFQLELCHELCLFHFELCRNYEFLFLLRFHHARAELCLLLLLPKLVRLVSFAAMVFSRTVPLTSACSTCQREKV